MEEESRPAPARRLGSVSLVQGDRRVLATPCRRLRFDGCQEAPHVLLDLPRQRLWVVTRAACYALDAALALQACVPAPQEWADQIDCVSDIPRTAVLHQASGALLLAQWDGSAHWVGVDVPTRPAPRLLRRPGDVLQGVCAVGGLALLVTPSVPLGSEQRLILADMASGEQELEVSARWMFKSRTQSHSACRVSWLTTLVCEDGGAVVVAMRNFVQRAEGYESRWAVLVHRRGRPPLLRQTEPLRWRSRLDAVAGAVADTPALRVYFSVLGCLEHGNAVLAVDVVTAAVLFVARLGDAHVPVLGPRSLLLAGGDFLCCLAWRRWLVFGCEDEVCLVGVAAPDFARVAARELGLRPPRAAEALQFAACDGEAVQTYGWALAM